MEYIKLIDVCDFQGGSQPPKSEWINKATDGYIRMLQIRDFTQDREEKEFVKLTNTIKTCKKDDVLIARYGASVGKILTGLEGAYNVAIMKSIPDENKINKKYLYYYFHTQYFQHNIKNVGSRAAQAGFNISELDKFNIYLAELDDQKKIVEVLDKAQFLIDKKKEQIELLDELVKSRFVEIFGDVLTSNKFGESILKEVADITSSKRIYANEYVENGIPFYRSKEIRELGENLKPSIELFISEEKYNLIKEKYEIPKKGDILIAAIGATIGYTWIVNTDEPFYYKDGNLLNISVNKNMNPIYLNHVLKILINNFKYREASGSAQLALTIDKVGKMEIPVPPIELQNEFAEFVTQTDSIRSKMEASLSELEDNFNSLMQKAFKGELF